MVVYKRIIMKTYYHHNDNGYVYEHVYVVDRAHKQVITYFINPAHVEYGFEPIRMVRTPEYMQVLANIATPEYTKWTKAEFEQWLFINEL